MSREPRRRVVVSQRKRSVAIMQPYLFPYVGYFQLLSSVDTFVFYDDAAFIKQGWINRNRMLVSGSAAFFTVPLKKASSSKSIKETMIQRDMFPRWRLRFLQTLRESYASSERLERVLELVAFCLGDPAESIATLAQRSIELCCEYLGLESEFLVSSKHFPGSKLRGQHRVIQICRELGASQYVNPLAGQDLYDRGEFARCGVRLSFLRPRVDPYPQFRGSFVPSLSILDLMLQRDRKTVKRAVRLGSVE